MQLDDIKISRAIIDSYRDKIVQALDVDVAILRFWERFCLSLARR